jgi:hypothetical protein
MKSQQTPRSTVVDIIDEIHAAEGLMTAVFTLLERVEAAYSEPLHAVAHEVSRRIKVVEGHAEALHDHGPWSRCGKLENVPDENAFPESQPAEPMVKPALIHAVISSLGAANDRLAALYLMCDSIEDVRPRMAFRQVIEDAENSLAGDIRALEKWN